MLRRALHSFMVILALAIAGSLAAQQDAPPAGQAPGQGQGQGQSQGQRQGRRGMNGPPPLMGTITSVGVDRFEIKRADGTTQIVMVNDQTHFRQRQPGQQQPQDLHLEDLKVGDHVFVRSSSETDKSAAAAAVNRVSDEDYQRFQNGGGPGGPGGGRFGGGGGPRAGGEIVSIKGNQIKVQSRRAGERVIMVNDQTTFMKEGKTITLKDLQVGDRIFATGQETNGQFVATQVRSGFGGGRGGFQGPPPQN